MIKRAEVIEVVRVWTDNEIFYFEDDVLLFSIERGRGGVVTPSITPKSERQRKEIEAFENITDVKKILDRHNEVSTKPLSERGYSE